MARTRLLGWKTGVGLVMANMIGSGVFLSAGFMAQSMSPGAIIAAWVVGTVLALAGARAYADVARLVPRSGGEYRYLSELLHPSLGYVAGWTSLLIGFSAPIAIDAVAAAEYFGFDNGKLVGVGLIGLLTLFHLADLAISKWTQNILVIIKITLVAAFVVIGLVWGSMGWPDWTPPEAPEGLGVGVFMGSLFFVAFAFSGWNAAIYAAEEFEDPRRDVPRAMLVGCAVVGGLYLLINWIMVSNFTPEAAQAVFGFGETGITAGHVAATEIAGPRGGRVMSVFIGVAFISAMSAMIFIGPRVYAAMAKDGFLPRAFAGSDGKPPVLSLLLQGAIAVFLIYVQSVREVLYNVGAILVLFSALTAIGLLVAWRRGRQVSRLAIGCAIVYVGAAAWMIYFGITADHIKSHLLVWFAVIVGVSLAAYAITRASSRGR